MHSLIPAVAGMRSKSDASLHEVWTGVLTAGHGDILDRDAVRVQAVEYTYSEISSVICLGRLEKCVRRRRVILCFYVSEARRD